MKKEERNYLVYLHINKTNKKVYVGITKHTDDPNKRWKRGNGYEQCIKFYNAIKKYGWDNFDHIILCKTTESRACLLEKCLVALYMHQNKSYNIALGGKLSMQSEEMKKKISEKLKGKKKSPEHIAKMKLMHNALGTKRTKESLDRAVATRRRLDNYTKRPFWLWDWDKSGENNPMYGKKHKEESLRKKYKAVLQYDLNNNFIREYESIKLAAKTVNISCTHLVSALKGRSKTAAKYIWRYKDE